MPAWFKNARIYHILIDRFAGYKTDADDSKPVFCGGNLNGILHKINYLLNQDINCIWLSPFYKTTAYHGYHITDYFEVDPRFGTEKDLIDLINACHSEGIKVIADFVPNHCSHKHPYFLDACSNKQSQYRDWFYFQKWPDSYLCFLNCNELPKLNLDNPETAEHLIQSAEKWLKLGLDGYRIDHIVGIPPSFLKQLRQRLTNINPDAVLIGEAWLSGIKFKHLKTLKIKNKYQKWVAGTLTQKSVQQYYCGIIDGVLDFQFRDILLQLKDKSKKLWQIQQQINKALTEHYAEYPKDYFLGAFLDNHDINRILHELGNDKELMQKALEILESVNQPKIYYYGTENFMTHKNSVFSGKPHADLNARKLMRE